YHDAAEWPGLLPPGLDLRVAETRHETLGFDTLPQLLHHLRETGVTGNSRARWSRRALAEAERRWRHEFPGPNGGLGLSYVSVHVLARRGPERT
ncbi:hypothetical protein LCGC14_2574410, partial [marine sediment metagenome]